MGKFLKMISDNSDKTLIRRANSIDTAARIAQENLVNQLRSEKTNIELEIADLTDLAPTCKDSLRPGSSSFDPKEWTEKLQEFKERQYEIQIQLKLAEDTYKEFFGDDND